ncbi:MULTISPECIES: oxidoreductase [Sphingobium]|uniref:Oxidoreductase n=1 Tax=Sphingobium tyrosinilyticum TaxID=2715436 RepID=A0ABV9EZW4_9SPHN|nr:oxidoreductase [Sphingobium sp. EP60837]ANI77823.1 Protochlorophyllide reductase [Sphingobium sp. EP60837]
MGFKTADVPDQHGRTILITGANTGIGFEAAKALASKGARVLLGCRDADRGEAAIRDIAAAAPGADLDLVLLDQADLVSVHAAAERIAGEPRLDVLLNNAGVMIPPLSRTVQGFELQFGVNHLGTFALTALLLPKLAQTLGSRVVVTSSLAHRRGRMLWDDWNAERSYDPARYYGQSKLANLLFVLELDRRLRAAGSPVHAIGCHPGVSLTELMRHLPRWTQSLMPLARPLFNPVSAAAWPALQAATDPQAQGGDYFGPQGPWEMRGVSGSAVVESFAREAENARRLWDLSVELTGIDPGLPAV